MKQQALDECKALKEKAEASDQRIFELEERNLSLENELSKSYKTSVTLQGMYKYPFLIQSISSNFREVRICYQAAGRQSVRI